MTDLPAPFTPEDCDLRGYEWMPLFGARLFSSNFEAHASDLAFRVAIRLYWACWLQVPAASLPNDDVQLCRLAGLGRDMKGWRRLRADGVLHGFILCLDDRLYHRLLADEATKAWDCKQKKESERTFSRERMRRWRNDAGISPQAWEELRSAVFQRDRWTCVDCGSTERLHCDHIIPLAHGGSNDPDNLATRCVICHGRKTAKQQNPNKRRNVTAHNVSCEPEREPDGEPTVSRTVSPRAESTKEDSTGQYRTSSAPKPPQPSGSGGPPLDGFGQKFGTRADGTNPRSRGENPRNRPKYRNAFHLVDRELAAGNVIDLNVDETADFRDFHGKIRRLADG